MEQVSLQLFGAPGAWRWGEAVPLHRKPLALLAYLAVTGEAVARAQLAVLLWPEHDAERSQANLRKAIWSLHRALGDVLLGPDSGGGGLALAPGVASDVADFERRLRAARRHGCDPGGACPACRSLLAEATELYRGDFLAGFGLSDSPDFDDWQLLQAERLRLACAGALDRLAALHEAARDPDAAMDAAQRRLDLDPLHEPAQRRIMRLLARAGRRREAQRQFERCRAALRDALGEEPEAVTRDLARAIASGAWPPAEQFTERPAAPADRTRPLSERLAADPPAASRAGARSAAATRGRAPAAATRGRAPAAATRGRAPAAAARPAREPVLGKEALQQARRALLTAVVDPRATVALHPAEARRLAAYPPRDLDAYYLGRVAEWCGPRHRLDTRFVQITLLLDRGEAAEQRWVPQAERFGSLPALLDAIDDPALVLLGPPGAGKSTLLRQLELQAAEAALQRRARTVPFLESLAAYRPDAQGRLPEPWDWLQGRWARRYPGLGALATLAAEGRLLLLLDGLNEMPHRGTAEYQARVAAWRAFIAERLAASGSRAVFSCRSLDYSAPLSSGRGPVPQARLEPLSDAQIQAFLEAHAPDRAARLWAALCASCCTDAFRTPYLLRLLAEEQDGARGDLAALFTAFVRRALARELARGLPELEDPALFEARDARQLGQGHAWPSAYALPRRGALVPALEQLGWAMQDRAPAGEAAGVRLDPEAVRAILGENLAAAVIRAGLSLGLLDEDLATDELCFSHQLLQEYFAARRFAEAPEPERGRLPWRVQDQASGLEALLAGLPPSEPLPGAPATGWEEVMRLATAMCPAPEAFLRDLADRNLPLAGRCALGAGVSEDLRCWLAWRLAERTGDRGAEVRARVAAGLALGPLGDPRASAGAGPDGAFRLGPLVDVPAGTYPIGDDVPIHYLGRDLGHAMPRHRVALPAFRIGRFAVTNAEFACFLAAGGYEDERWWLGPMARAWRRGQGTAEGHRQAVRYWWRWFRERPELVEEQLASGAFSEERHALWRRRLAMSPAELELYLRDLHPDAVLREPLLWRDPAFNNPAQPVVGISWVEAGAYCRWLAAQTGLPVRLPSEVEWEAAARGAAGRRYPSGDDYFLGIGNTQDLRARRTTPVGVFPEGETPEGASDLCGNVWDWTRSLWGADMRQPERRYPYDPADGREDPAAPAEIYRVVRGGAWVNGRTTARADYRGMEHPFDRTNLHGFRVLVQART